MDGGLIPGLPEGLTARGATPGDARAILGLVAEAELAADGVIEVDLADVEMGFGRPGFDPANDCVLVFERDLPVAWSELYRERAEGDVRPSHTGRGIGTALLRWTEARARELGRGGVSQTVTDRNVAAAALFRSGGYGVEWIAWILEIAFDRPPPVHPPPQGIALRAYEPSRDDRAAYRLIDDAFNEWEGRSSIPFGEWAAEVIRHAAFSPELSRLAFEGDELVGVALAFDYGADGEGWVQQLATKATHRHRGIARALLSSVFGAFYERGKTRCGLSTESRTGALSLYERVGMRVRRSYTRYRRDLG